MTVPQHAAIEHWISRPPPPATFGYPMQPTLTAAERALVAELRTELEPQYPGVRHWSPLLGRWCVDFEPDQWIGAA